MAYHTTTDNLLAEGLATCTRTPVFYPAINVGAETLAASVISISFSNTGPSPATVLESTLPAGASISFDAGGAGNRFAPNSFTWDSTGTTLLIAYTY